MNTAPPERAYCARRIAAGIYLQPSNDGQRFYVIAKREDGSDYGLDDPRRRFTFWAFAEITPEKLREVERASGDDHTTALQMLVDATDLWGVRTKAEAVAAALADDEARYA